MNFSFYCLRKSQDEVLYTILYCSILVLFLLPSRCRHQLHVMYTPHSLLILDYDHLM